MPGRVLNFLEFSDKYSDGSDNQVSLDDIKNASSNFEEGFDEETYDQPQIGANRPVSGEYEMTPSSPGESGAPSFTSDNSEEMNAPEENEESDEEEFEESDETENEESEEESEEAEEGESNEATDEGNPESGANPKKKVDEGFTLVKGFQQFVNEDCEACGEHIEDDKFAEDSTESDICDKCGEEYIANEYGTSCGCNM